MGIPKFRRWMQSTFPHCFQLVPGTHRARFDQVYFDMNALLHLSGRKVKKNVQFMKRVFASLNDFIRRPTAPNQLLYFAMDGTSPWAKTWVQRSRREEMLVKLRTYNGAKIYSKGISTVELSPGTALMESVTQYMRYYACQTLLFNPVLRKSHNAQAIVSGSDVPGEGEHKIIQHLIASHHFYSNFPKPQNRTSVIVGADADLFLMTVAAGVPDVYFFLMSHTKGKSPAHENHCFSVNLLLNDLAKLHGVQVGDERFHQARMDFVILHLFAGNDYLPKLHGSAVDYLWKAYAQVVRNETFAEPHLYDWSSKSIRLDVLREVLGVCVSMMPESRFAATEMEDEDEDEDAPVPAEDEEWNSAEEGVAVPEENGDVEEDGDAAKESDDQEDEESDDEIIVMERLAEQRLEDKTVRLKKRVVDAKLSLKPNVPLYMEGILWCLDLYATGTCSDYEYEYLPRSSVSIQSLCQWLDGELASPAKNNRFALPPPTNPPTYTKPIHHHIAPLLLIPKTKKWQRLIPEELHEYADVYLDQCWENLQALQKDHAATRSVFSKSILDLDSPKIREVLRRPHGMNAVYTKRFKDGPASFYAGTLEEMPLPFERTAGPGSSLQPSLQMLPSTTNMAQIFTAYHNWLQLPGLPKPKLDQPAPTLPTPLSREFPFQEVPSADPVTPRKAKKHHARGGASGGSKKPWTGRGKNNKHSQARSPKQ